MPELFMREQAICAVTVLESSMSHDCPNGWWLFIWNDGYFRKSELINFKSNFGGILWIGWIMMLLQFVSICLSWDLFDPRQMFVEKSGPMVFLLGGVALEMASITQRKYDYCSKWLGAWRGHYVHPFSWFHISPCASTDLFWLFICSL